MSIIEIARKVRRTAWYDGCRAYGLCFLLSKELMYHLRLEAYPCRLIQGAFLPTIIKDHPEYAGYHCWVELYDLIVDITASQFTEIEQDILIGTYENYPQYIVPKRFYED